MNRRQFLAGVALCGVMPTRSWSQDAWPSRPIRIVTGYSAGGAGDVSWRVAAEKLTALLGQPVVVENRVSAGAITAAMVVKQAPADGYTFLHAASGNFAMTPYLFQSLPFDPAGDFQMISELTRHTLALYTRADARFETLQDVMAAARAQPGRLNIGIIAIGSGTHLAAEYFKSVAGLDVVLVPYRSSPDLLVSLMQGDVQFSIDTLAPVLAHIRAGRLRAVAITDPAGFVELPSVPTFRDAGLQGFEAFTAWNGLAARRETPQPIIDRMAAEIAKVAAMPDVRARFLELGLIATSTTPAESQAILRRDIVAQSRLLEEARVPRQ